MHRRAFLSASLAFPMILFLVILPHAASAANADAVSRKDGFLLIWEGIRRPAQQTSETPFHDLDASDPAFPILRYAKARGIIEDHEPAFRPNDPLSLSDALLWMFRTRNVDEMDLLTPDHVPDLLSKYPLGDFVTVTKKPVDVRVPGSDRVVKRTEVTKSIADRVLTRDELTRLIATLDSLLAKEVHEISFYAEWFQGKGTAYGEKFDYTAMTAASKTFPYNTMVRVTNLTDGKSVVVRINDRGPFVPGRDMDLSLAAFNLISDRSHGKTNATFERLGDVSLVSTCAQTALNTRGSTAAQARRAKRMQKSCV